MTYIIKPRFHHPALPKNALGFTHRDYEGSVSTLCAGCGHDSISAAIIQACFELDLPPHRVAKMSGIGCSSKTPTYFLGQSHGFNAVHGRMPTVATGASLANRDLIYLGPASTKILVFDDADHRLSREPLAERGLVRFLLFIRLCSCCHIFLSTPSGPVQLEWRSLRLGYRDSLATTQASPPGSRRP